MKLTDSEIVMKVLESCGWKVRPHNVWEKNSEQFDIKYGYLASHILTSRDACFAVFANDAPHEFWRMLAEDLVKIPGPIPYKATARQLCLAWLRYKGIDIGDTV